MTSRKRVLVVDDDAAIRETLEHTLVAEGYKVYSADDGRDALNQLMSIPLPNAIITDLSMPMPGRDFIGHLKANPLMKNIPVIVLTAEKDARDLVDVAVAVIEKPFMVDDLLAAVGAAVGR